MKLTNTYIKNLRPNKKLKRHPDGRGLYLTVAVSGSKIWEHRCYYKNSETYLVLGNYPEISILDARQARDVNKQLIKQGIHPRDIKMRLSNSQSSEKTFNDMFVEWHDNKKDEWSDNYGVDVTQRAACYLLPFIGDKPISDISTPNMLKLLKDIESQGLIDTLEKVKGIASRVFSYSVGMGIIEINPVRDLPLDVFKKKQNKHYATVTDPSDISWLLKTIDGHRGSYQVRASLTLAPHVFLRPGELTALTWKEVEFDTKLIRINGSRMKMKKDHLVPMSTQVFNILQDLSRVKTNSNYVFPSPRNRNKPITTNALLTAFRSLGINKEQFTTHGFRHMASTRLNELGFRGDIIERQLSHTESDKVRAAYNHADHLSERREMMQKWSNYLEKLKSQ
jgi:integrase